MAQEQPANLHPDRAVPYTPSAQIKQSQKEFADSKFGIFIHWGIYSMFAQGEWYLNSGLDAKEYAKAASGFYPANFNAHDWVKAIKDAGAKYICITSRHHDGFSMWDTKQSDYNIVDATPFKEMCLRNWPTSAINKTLNSISTILTSTESVTIIQEDVPASTPDVTPPRSTRIATPGS